MNDFNDNKISAIVGIGGVLLSMIVIILGARTNSGVITIVGVILFVLAIVAGIIVGKVTDAAEKAKYMRGLSGGSVKTTSKYQLLLMDERTKQHPDVQRLLQYLSVQKTFFDPNYLATAEAQNDPYVRELMSVFDRMIENGEANGDLARYTNVSSSSAYVSELNKREQDRREREKKRPRKIAGTVITVAGVLLFCSPFFAVFLGATGVNDLDPSFFMMTAPFGMMLAIVGSIIKK